MNYKDTDVTAEKIDNVTIAAKGHEGSQVAAKEATKTEHGNVAHYACEVCNKNFESNAADAKEIENVVIYGGYKVDFVGATKTVVYTAMVLEGEQVSDEDIAAASSKLEEVFGYIIAKDEAQNVIWGDDIKQSIMSDITFYAHYEKNTALTSAVTIKDTNGDYIGGYNAKPVVYDTKITVNDENATAWLRDTAVIATGKTLTVYACGGEMIITATKDSVTASGVAIVGSIMKNGTFSVFAHTDESNIKEIGIIFAGNSNVATMKNVAAVKESLANGEKKYALASIANPKEGQKDFMGSLTGIKAGKTRNAVAYVITEQGTYYSEIETKTNGEVTE